MSAKYSTNRSFNPMQIKDGWIVRMGKDGKIRERLELYRPKIKK